MPGTDIELARALFPKAKDVVAAGLGSSVTVRTERGRAVSDSSEGLVEVVLDTVVAGGDATIECPTSCSISEGDEVLVYVSGTTPVDVVVAGEGDRQDERIHAIEADYVKASTLEADVADIGFLKADSATIRGLQADTAKVHDLTADQLSAATAYIATLTANSVTAASLTADVAKVHDLTADQLSAAAAYIAQLSADSVTAQRIAAISGDFDTVRANAAKVANLTAAELEADHATIGSLDANYAKITNGHIDSALIDTAAIVDEQVFTVTGNKATLAQIDASKINVLNLKAKDIEVERINGQPVTNKTLVDALSQHETDISDLDTKIDDEVEALNDRIDGAIETFTGTVVPTLSNTPASSWNTTKLKDQHVGDVYYVVNSQSAQNGYCYRFTKSGSTYSWQLIKDSDVTAALSRLQTAEGKIGNIEQFDETVGSFMTDTDDELSSLKTRATSLETSLGDKVDTSTFNTVSQKVDENSASISTLSETVSTKADQSTVTTLSNTVNTVKQTADTNKSNISSLQTTVSGHTTTIQQHTTSITQNTEDIALRATKTEVQQVRPAYASSSTAAGTAAKVATIDPAVTGYALYKGASVAVTFSTANTAATPTLNLNSTGAKQIRSYTGAALSEAEYKWAAGATIDLVYDGTYWRMQDGGAVKRVTAAEASISVNAENIESKVSKDGVISSINQSAETVKIQASQVEIDGTAVFSVISSDVDDAITSKGYQTSSQVNSAITSKGYATTTQAQGYASTAKSEAISAAATDAATKASNTLASAKSYADEIKQTVSDWVLDPMFSTGADKFAGVVLNATPPATLPSGCTSCGMLTTRDHASGIQHYGKAGHKLRVHYWCYCVPDSGSTVSPSKMGVGFLAPTANNYADVAKTSASGKWFEFSAVKIVPANTTSGWAKLFIQQENASGTTNTGRWYITGLTVEDVTESAAAMDVANAAAPKANAVKRTQRIWYRTNASSAPSTPGTTSSNWVTKADDGNDAWTKMHVAITSTHKRIYTCEQYEMANGTVGYTSVLLDNTITVIDGGNIITGSVTANKLNAADINASKSLTVGAMTDAAASTILNSNIQVGGRNLLLGAATQDTSVGNSRESVNETNDTWLGCKVFRSSAAWADIGFRFDIQVVNRGLAKAGDVLTYSIWAKTDDTTSRDIYGIWITNKAGGNHMQGAKIATLTSEWTRYEKQITVTQAMLNAATVGMATRFECNTNCTSGKYIYWAAPKLEKGNKATDWTPAPEDMATAESLAGTNESLEGAIEDIGELSDQLVGTVTEQNKTITTIQTYLNSLRKDLDAEIQSRQQWLNFNAAEGLVIGAAGSTFKTVTTNTSQQFRSGGTVLAETSGAEFVAPIMRSDQLLIGNWMWTRRDNGNLSLKWIG